MSGPAQVVVGEPSHDRTFREDRAGATAAHRDHPVGGLDRVDDEDLRRLVSDVDDDLGHRFDGGGIHRLSGGEPAERSE